MDRTIKTDTQGCGAGLVDIIHLLTSHSLIEKLKILFEVSA